MSHAELKHALARVLEGKEIRLKNNKLPLQSRCNVRFRIPRVETHWPVIFAKALTDIDYSSKIGQCLLQSAWTYNRLSG
jgi:hypothetical protein